MNDGEIDQARLAPTLYEQQPAECETIAGFEVYALDTTPDERPEAETLAERGFLKAEKNEPVRFGQKFSWLVRLVKQRTSWVAPWDVRRVTMESNDNQTAAEQVKALDGQSPRPKVVVSDSLYANQVFLAVFLLVKTVFASECHSVRTATAQTTKNSRRTLQAWPSLQDGQSVPSTRPHRNLCLGLQEIRLSAWHKLHFRQLPQLIGLVLRVEFLKPDGSLRYQRPMWLFWTGREIVALQDLCRMYLWRVRNDYC